MPGFVFYGGVPMPESVANELRNKLEYQRLSAEAQTERQQSLIETADSDTLQIIRDFVRGSAHDSTYGHYLVGLISSTLRAKHSICTYCGEKHETLEDLVTAHGPSEPVEKSDDEGS